MRKFNICSDVVFGPPSYPDLSPRNWSATEITRAAGVLGVISLLTGEDIGIFPGSVGRCDKVEDMEIGLKINKGVVEDRSGPLGLLLCDTVGVDLSPVPPDGRSLPGVPWTDYISRHFDFTGSQ